MPIIDKYDLKASVQFPISGTDEVTENLQLTVSAAAAAGVVAGTVTSGGAPIEGATVKVFDVNDNPIAHDLTNPEGKYTIQDVAAGSYKITATKFTYLTPDAIPFSVVANRPTTVNIALTLDPDVNKNALYGFIKQAVIFTPIQGATVNIYQVVDGVRTLALTTMTNSSGQYFGPRLVTGDFVVVANKTGYELSTSSTITLIGTDIQPLDLFLQVNTLQNVGTVSGFITDQTTLLPIANALVALYLVVGGVETITQITRTNAGGRYLFGDVAEGEYVVKAIAQTDVPGIQRPCPMAIRDIYLLQRSEQFSLGPRQEVTVDLSLKHAPEEPCTVLMGCVAGKCGQIEGSTVKVLDRRSTPIAHTVTDHEGKFVFENTLPPGEYQVIATAEGYKISRVYRLMLESRKPVSIFIWLEVSDYLNLATVYGVVYNEVNSGLANAKILITNYDKPEINEVYTQTNEDGEYLVYGLKPGEYRITALIEGYMPPEKISFELFPSEISCVNLFLYPDLSVQDGTISGRIDHYDKGVPNAVVALYKVEGSGHILLATKETNESGFYLFPNVKPGEYLIKSKMESNRTTDFTV